MRLLDQNFYIVRTVHLNEHWKAEIQAVFLTKND